MSAIDCAYTPTEVRLFDVCLVRPNKFCMAFASLFPISNSFRWTHASLYVKHIVCGIPTSIPEVVGDLRVTSLGSSNHNQYRACMVGSRSAAVASL